MKKISVLTLTSILMLALTMTNCIAHEHNSTSNGSSLCLDNINIDIEDGTLILTNKNDDDETVEITEDYELYVNGRYIRTDYREDKLIRDYYDKFMEIIDYAKANDIDLIAMSTHGRSGIGRWVFGSVTDKVLHAGDTPVLVVSASKGPK